MKPTLYAIKLKCNNTFLKVFTYDKNCQGITETGKLHNGDIMVTPHKGLAETIQKSLSDNFEVVEVYETLVYKEGE